MRELVGCSCVKELVWEGSWACCGACRACWELWFFPVAAGAEVPRGGWSGWGAAWDPL